VNYIINNESEYRKNPDDLAEAIWTLASLKDSRALSWWTQIDPKTLSRHGYLAYSYAAQQLGKYSTTIDATLKTKLSQKDNLSWYWTREADRALYAQLLLERQDRA
jgi:hypothetical protein